MGMRHVVNVAASSEELAFIQALATAPCREDAEIPGIGPKTQSSYTSSSRYQKMLLIERLRQAGVVP